METPISPTIVTGGGRCGTTAFMRFIQKAKGMDSCVSDAIVNENATLVYTKRTAAGYEYTLNPTSPPEVFEYCPDFIKAPTFCINLNSLILGNKVDPKHVFVLIRDYKKAAKSRIDNGLHWLSFRHVNQCDSKYDDFKNQEIFMQRAIGVLFCTISKFDIPHTIIRFPDFVNNKDYLHKKLKGTPLEPSEYDFDLAFAEFNTDLVHY